MERDQPTTPTSTPLEDTQMQPSYSQPRQEPSRINRYSPNDDFYNDCFSFSPLIYASLIMVFVLGLKLSILHGSDTYQFMALPYYYFTILIAVVLCRHTPTARTTQLMVWTCCFVFYSAVLGYCSFFPAHVINMVIYFPTCAVITIFAEWKIWRASKVLN